MVRATFHPSSIAPITLAAGTRASVRNTSQNSAPPFICFSGRASTPAWRMSMTIQVMPRCLGTSGLVRASNMPHSLLSALEFHTF